MQDIIITPSEFVAAVNQTLEFAYPTVVIEGELTNLRISKNKWVYFDLKDEYASVKFFGTVYGLPGPLEDGMLLKVTGQPQLNPRYGFNVTFRQITPVGEGSLVKAAQLLQAKLEREGLFDVERKRPLPYPPTHIGLIASGQSAAYADFIKILHSRWGGLQIDHIDVQVQGDKAVVGIVQAFEKFNMSSQAPEVVILTRGGGSADDLSAFNTEQVTRAVAGSRSPTVVAVGHEVDTSLAELAADMRASTPSNAAELLVPDRTTELKQLKQMSVQLKSTVVGSVAEMKKGLSQQSASLSDLAESFITRNRDKLESHRLLLEQLNPEVVLRRGYAVVRGAGQQTVTSIEQVSVGNAVTVRLKDGLFDATVDKVK